MNIQSTSKRRKKEEQSEINGKVEEGRRRSRRRKMGDESWYTSAPDSGLMTRPQVRSAWPAGHSTLAKLSVELAEYS